MRVWMCVEAPADRDEGYVTPPPSTVSAKIAKRIGEAVGREAADDVETRTGNIAHAHDEAHEAQQRYLESRPGPHS